jgi:phosphoglycolate phosphatase-like HAD superfamily hydrolase
MTYALFWDIDGTLLTTQKAGVFAIEEACRAVLGRDIDLAAIDMRGVPDTEIAARILAHAGHRIDDDTVRRFLDVYETNLPSRLFMRNGSALPGVRPVLQHLRRRADVLFVLLTGNTRLGAAAKLKHYGLAEFFSLGAFADGTRDRLRIAEAALAVAEESIGRPIPPERRFVIGDTPHDVACGKAIDAKTIVVATGGYSLEELRSCGPWQAWPSLPEPPDFERALGLLPAALVESR